MGRSNILLVFAAGACTVGLLAGLLGAAGLRRISWRSRVWVYALLTAASVWPFVLHYDDSLLYLQRSGVEPYIGLHQFTVLFPIVVAAMAMAALVAARFFARCAAVFPLLFGAVYWFHLIRLLQIGTPAGYPGLDNIPFVWLFAWSFAATTFLLVVAQRAIDRKPGSTGT